MKATRLLVFFGMALAMDVAHAAGEAVAVVSQGETIVASASRCIKIQVRIKTHEVQIGKSSDARPAVIESNCTYSKYPCSIVDQLEIIVNGTALFVPRSAFCSLADLNKAEVKAGKKEWILRLDGGDGGDGAESFIAKIEFDATQVQRRTPAGGASADQLTEETRYHTVVFD
jgi:hypothetical protein